MALTRLNKLLSQAGAASRRLADELIQQGRVEVNGAVVAELGGKADPAVDDIRVDGRRLKIDVQRRYLLMNKPRGVLSSRSDPHQRRTVIDLLAAARVKGYFYPVGRLDYESEGLILLTNDGAFADKVTHPRYELERTYEALVLGVPDDRALDRLRTGVVIEGRKTLPAVVRLVRVVDGREKTQAVLELTLREGRNRQVRHMCSAIGHPVDRLKRIRIGGLSDRNLHLGDIRDLTAAEVQALMAPARSPSPAPGRTSPRSDIAGTGATNRTIRRPAPKPDRRSDARGDARPDRRPDKRSTARPETRGPARSDKGSSARPRKPGAGAPDARGTSRPDARSKDRPDTRNGARAHTRAADRPDTRKSRPPAGRTTEDRGRKRSSGEGSGAGDRRPARAGTRRDARHSAGRPGGGPKTSTRNPRRSR